MLCTSFSIWKKEKKTKLHNSIRASSLTPPEWDIAINKIKKKKKNLDTDFKKNPAFIKLTTAPDKKDLRSSSNP